MREFIQAQYDVEVIRWDEPTGEGDVVFEVVYQGRMIRADSLALILAAVQERARQPLRLAGSNVDAPVDFPAMSYAA